MKQRNSQFEYNLSFSHCINVSPYFYNCLDIYPLCISIHRSISPLLSPSFCPFSLIPPVLLPLAYSLSPRRLLVLKLIRHLLPESMHFEAMSCFALPFQHASRLLIFVDTRHCSCILHLQQLLGPSIARWIVMHFRYFSPHDSLFVAYRYLLLFKTTIFW